MLDRPLVIGDVAKQLFVADFHVEHTVEGRTPSQQGSVGHTLERWTQPVPQPHIQQTTYNELQPALTQLLTSTDAPAPKSNSHTTWAGIHNRSCQTFLFILC